MARRGVSGYALVQATVRALRSEMLMPKTWTALVRADGFDAILNILSDTAYGPYLEIERHLLTPRRVVYQIRWHLAEAYEKLIRITPEPGQQLLLRLWQAYEVDNLKATLRGLETGASWDQVLHLLSPMRKYISLTLQDMERMVRAGTIPLAVERIRHTPYYDTLFHALERYQAEKSLFPLEVALDLDHRRKVWQAINHLGGTDYEQALRLVGTTLDVDNLLWAIRYRVYHHLSEEEIINYTLPIGYQVQDIHIRAIARGDDISDVVHSIHPGIEWSGRPDGRPGEELVNLERALQRHIIELCQVTFLGNPFHIGLPVAHLLLNEYEITELTTLIEAKASRLPLAAFEPVLIGLAAT
jgi:V/A-type H+-transporting ATPase subunit C